MRLLQCTKTRLRWRRGGSFFGVVVPDVAADARLLGRRVGAARRRLVRRDGGGGALRIDPHARLEGGALAALDLDRQDAAGGRQLFRLLVHLALEGGGVVDDAVERGQEEIAFLN